MYDGYYGKYCCMTVQYAQPLIVWLFLPRQSNANKIYHSYYNNEAKNDTVSKLNPKLAIEPTMFTNEPQLYSQTVAKTIDIVEHDKWYVW